MEKEIYMLFYCNECTWQKVAKGAIDFCEDCGHVNIGASQLRNIIFTNKQTGKRVIVTYSLTKKVADVQLESSYLGVPRDSSTKTLLATVMRGKRYDKVIFRSAYWQEPTPFIEVTPDDIFMSDEAVEMFDVEEISPFK